MSQIEFRKACYVCGEDVTHKSRHKNRRGQYVCPKCVEAKKRSPRHSLSKRLGVSPNLLILYIALAVVGGGLFYLCLYAAIELMTAI